MGSPPLVPTLPNAFLCHYERIWLHESSLQIKPVAYRPYVTTFLLCLFKVFCQLHKLETKEFKTFL